MHATVLAVTHRIIDRSRDTRAEYLHRMAQAKKQGVYRARLSCGNLAHGFAACNTRDKEALTLANQANVGIVSAYNDMLSAHQPYQHYPALIHEAVREMGSVAQFAGGVPAMCDGVTQGQPGMELSLFSRDVIAMSTAIALSHNMFDAVLCLGVCDKIVPGLLIGALSFGHLPIIFVPAGPMTSGLPNEEKARIRQLYAEGKVDRSALLKCESESYHSAGTCTFYGTANSNQLVMEAMGLHLPGASFINPGKPLRDELTREAARQACRNTVLNGKGYRPLADIVTEKTIVNGMVALLASGGSTNHTLHLVAMARAAGIQITWEDFSDLSDAIPLLTRIYPNGHADINHFQAAGGMGLLLRELLDGGFLHEQVKTIVGDTLRDYLQEPFLEEGKLVWRDATEHSLDNQVIASRTSPFSPNGGLTMLKGNLGRAVIKVSAVKPEHQVIEAPAVIFHDQHALERAFHAGELERDFIAVVRFQGPAAIGMPELHKLTPFLGILQDRGFKVALVTDGRMSGASGKVPAAIHVSPEAMKGGLINRIHNGDMIRIDARTGTLELQVDPATLAARKPASFDNYASHWQMGRELFASMRHSVGIAEEGASIFFRGEKD